MEPGRLVDADFEQVDLATAAKRLDTTPDALRKKIKRHTLPAVTIEGKLYITLPRDAVPPVGSASSRQPDGAFVQPAAPLEAQREQALTPLRDYLTGQHYGQQEMLALLRQQNELLAEVRDELRRSQPAPPVVDTAGAGVPRPWWRSWWRP